MIFMITAKHCRVLAGSKKLIDMHLAKLDRVLEHLEEDLVVLRLTLRKDIDKYHPPRTLNHKSYGDTKPALANFAGSVYFRLGKNWIYAPFKGQSIDECIGLGFRRIFKELEKYKQIHFPSESRYPDHSTIRGA